MDITLPDNVKKVIRRLNEAGFEAFAEGGCVRDHLLGRIPQDYDVTTDARPNEVKRLFRRTVDTGIRHGTVTVLLGQESYEVTTYRIDGIYEDGRHPKEVTFSADLKEDLMRRDFTINAMAYHPDRGIVDLFGGQEDLSAGLVRCVGEADERFGEDALRVLRAYRFAAQLGFEIEEATREAAKRHAEDLKKISAERIREELVKILTSPHPEMVWTLYEDGVTARILPEFDACAELPQHSSFHIYTVGEHTIRAMQAIEPDPVLRLTMLLHDFGTPKQSAGEVAEAEHFEGHAEEGARIAERILRRLKFDNETIRRVSRLIYFHDFRPRPLASIVRRAMAEIGPDEFDNYLKVQRADADAKNPKRMASTYERIDAVEETCREIRANKDCLSVSGLAIDGNDLIAAGVPAGREIGFILDAALLAVLEDPSLNDRELLMLYAMQVHSTYRA